MFLKYMSLAIIVAAIPFTSAQADDLFDIFGGGLHGKKLERAIVKAAQYPLGSEQNPVRVNMPEGQRDYLSKLRCSDEKAPVFDRAGSVGSGPFGGIMDVYVVDCSEATPGKTKVFMDMYHPNHKEDAAVQGFIIRPE